MPLFGPGQGSTCGPIFCRVCYWLIVSSIDPQLHLARLLSVSKDICVEVVSVSFIDDTGLGVTSSYTWDDDLSDAANVSQELNHVLTGLSVLAQHWEWLLFSTWGVLNLQKCFWYLLHWEWPKGTPRLSTLANTPNTLEMTTGSLSYLMRFPKNRRRIPSKLWAFMFHHLAHRNSTWMFCGVMLRATKTTYNRPF